MAIGVVNRCDIANWNPPMKTIESVPNPIYKKNYKLFRRLYEQTKDIAQELST